MRITVVVVGKPRDRALATLIAEYEARAARYWPLAVVEVREEPGRGLPPDVVLRKEGERLLERAAGASVVICDVGGRTMSSPELARWLQSAREGARDLCFVIGGAHGLSEAVRARAWSAISLSALTLPHELARLVLAEQLYRAGTILRGEPYHK